MQISSNIDVIIENFKELKKQSGTIEKIAELWIEAIEGGNKVIFC